MADQPTHRLALKSTAAPATSPTLTTTQAATFLNIQPASMEQMRWRGTGPKFCKVGRCVRYRLADLEAYLEGRSFTSTTEALAARV